MQWNSGTPERWLLRRRGKSCLSGQQSVNHAPNNKCVLSKVSGEFIGIAKPIKVGNSTFSGLNNPSLILAANRPQRCLGTRGAMKVYAGGGGEEPKEHHHSPTKSYPAAHLSSALQFSATPVTSVVHKNQTIIAPNSLVPNKAAVSEV